MTDLLKAALVGAAPGIVASILGFVNNTLARRNMRHINEARASIVQLEKNTDGINAHLVKVTGQVEFARGVKEGKYQATGLHDEPPRTGFPS